MENFEYQAGTKVLFGKEQISNLPEIVKKYGSKILLCYGGGSIKRIGIYDEINHLLEGCELYELADIAPNPKIESVEAGVKICREHNIDVILAVGGGSVIDCAKVIAAAVYYQGKPWEMVKTAALTDKALPLITILTLAATGSEYDAGAVISNTATNEKLGYDSEYVRPKVSILNPEYTYSVSAKQTAAGSIDIISHLLEQYFAPHNTYMADQLLTASLRTAIRYAPVAVKEPENYEARGQLMWLSSLACNGIFSTGCQYGGWSCHGIEHELSAFYDVTHGIGLAIITPRWMRYILSKNPATASRFAQYGIDVFGISAELDTNEIADKAIDATENFFMTLGSPMSLSELGIGTEHFDEMAEHAVEANWLSYAYVPLDKNDVKEIFNMCI